MPRTNINRLIRRRARSIEIVNSVRALNAATDRRNKNQRLFEDRIRDNSADLYNHIQFDTRTVASAYNNSFTDVDITTTDSNDRSIDLLVYMSSLRHFLKGLIRNQWMASRIGGISFNLDTVIQFSALNDPTITAIFTLTSEFYTVFTFSDIIPSVDAACEDIMQRADEYQNGRSNWVIDEIYRSTLKSQSYQPSRAVTGGGRFSIHKRKGGSFMEIPLWLKNIKCTVNIENKDQRCFEYAMECAFQFKMNGQINAHATRVKQYEDKGNFNFGDLEFPFHPMDIEKFESLNREIHNVGINVYCVTDRKHDIGVIYQTSNRSEDAWIVNLLIHTEKVLGEQVNAHWVFIQSLDRLLHSSNAKTSNRKMYFCPRCTMGFYSQNKFNDHTISCQKLDAGRPVLPQEYEAFKYFHQFHKMCVSPFVIYADFEAFNMSLKHEDNETKTESSRLTEHVGASYAWKSVCRSHPEHNKMDLQCYKGEEVTDKYQVGKSFIQSITQEKNRLVQIYNDTMNYEPHGNEVDSKECCICHLDLEKGYMPHWQYTSYRTKDEFRTPSEYFHRRQTLLSKPIPPNYRKALQKENQAIVNVWDPTKEVDNIIGKAHFACNRKRPGSPDFRLNIPVVFHNLSGYDSHFILKALDPSSIPDINFSGIPQEGDSFMSFGFDGLRFIDSNRFMKESLQQLSENLLKNGRQYFSHFNDTFPTTDNNTDLLLQKGVFPYDYFKHPRVFTETQLPSYDDFFNSLRQEHISRDDYDRAHNVWNKHQCKTFKNFHDLYLKVDVLLLSDVFENFRTICLQEDKLEPLNYVSIPGYSMDSAFLRAGSEHISGQHIPFSVDLFHNGQEDMYLFVEESIRGGVSMTPGRYAKANHKYLDDYKPEDPASHILYLDANNLYGYAMGQKLPHSNYHWVNNIEDVDVMDVGEHSSIGYIFEVDGHFPNETHDRLSDFPLAPIKQAVSDTMLSPFSQFMNERYENTHDNKTEKLLCTLEPRVSYKCYYRTLQLYVKCGFVIDKIHRVLAFDQTNWLASYIQYNTDKRAKSTNSFEKDFYKLKNNAVYGKFIQNNRKFRKIKILDNSSDKISWDPTLRNRVIINENFVLGYMNHPTIELNSPVIIGTIILDHSKYLMYDFYYNVMKSRYEEKLKLLFTDTDSLCMQIFHEDPIKDLFDAGILADLFDLSDFPKNESYYNCNYHSNTNKKVIGKFKDEFTDGFNGYYIKEVVALRSKMYSCLSTNIEKPQKATAKGVVACVRKKITHDKYLDCIRQDADFQIESADMRGFRSSNHIISTVCTSKKTLSPCDSKLFIVDNIHTLPYGHYSITTVA